MSPEPERFTDTIEVRPPQGWGGVRAEVWNRFLDAGMTIHEADGLTGLLSRVLQRVEQERDTLRAQLADARKDMEFHAECRPNRRQAEVWRDDAKATNDRWADEVKARREAETALIALRAGLQQVIAEMQEMTDLHPYDVFGVHVLLGFRARLEELLAGLTANQGNDQ